MRFATVNWVGLVATQGPIFAIPLLVAFSVDSADNAPFYVAWSFGAMAFLLPQTIGQVTLSEANYDGQVSNKLIHGLKLALLLTCIAMTWRTEQDPDKRARLVALWLLYTPFYLELYMGQFSFVQAALVFVMLRLAQREQAGWPFDLAWIGASSFIAQ